MKSVNFFSVIAAELQEKARDLVHRTAVDVVIRAQRIVPVDTGTLRDSIQVGSYDAEGATVEVGAPYAAAVEFGTVHAPAQPYLHPAMDEARPDFEAALARLLEP